MIYPPEHPTTRTLLSRRQLLALGLATSFRGAQAEDHRVPTLLRQGGVVVVMRHALAPGTFDPPEFQLGDCSTQRLLSDEGRAQARRMGAWFEARQLRPERVRSSPWCRCLDTATLAFRQAQAWSALGSPYRRQEVDNALAQRALRQALGAVPRGKFEVWVTHDFVINALLGTSASSGEGYVVRGLPDGTAQVLEGLQM